MSKKLLSSIAAIGAAAMVLTGCASGDPLASEPKGNSDSSVISIGSANFPESELLAEMYAQALENAGYEVNRQFNIGARDLYLAALQDGSIDLLPEYNGALLSSLLQGGAPEGVTDSEEVYEALQDTMPEGIITLPQSEAQDKDTLAVTQETADKYSLTTIEDLAPIAGELSVAAGPEWAERYQGLEGLTELYGVTFGEFKPLDAGGPLTLDALLSGQVQVANIFSTDSAIATEGLVVLEDTKNLYLSENILPIIREAKATDEVIAALNAVSEALTTDNLTEYLAMVQVDKQASATVATAFLTEYGIL
ncbi:L-proline glycine betaine binding ABC transporter protein ProX [Leifsonia rubra CMS 76R]|nr:L-proline glycine betaine binding ABC transporter protein ProX [Leifsonia rubra CMS 76R]